MSPIINFGLLEYGECGVWSAERGVWEMRTVENEECGKWRLWRMGVWNIYGKPLLPKAIRVLNLGPTGF